MSEHTAKAVETRKARLWATQDRMDKREDAAVAAVKRAQEQLAKAQAKLQQVQAQARALVQKQAEQLSQAEQRHAQAQAREQEKLKARSVPAGTVETEDGVIRSLSREAVEIIQAHIGRHRKGVFRPLDGAEAQAVLSALDMDGSVGDICEVSIRGRKTAIVFSVEEEGLAFQVFTLTAAGA